MKKTLWVKVGYFSRTHGLKGGLALTLLQEMAGTPQHLYIQEGDGYAPLLVQSISSRPDLSFVKLEGVDTIEAAQRLRGISVFMPKEELVKPGKDGFFDEEILDFRVEDAQLGVIGRISRIAKEGGRRFLLVRQDSGQEFILPAEPAFVVKIDRRSKAVHTDLPDGFLAL